MARFWPKTRYNGRVMAQEIFCNFFFKTQKYPKIPDIPRNTRNTRKYPKEKKIPGNTRSYFSTLLPDPNPNPLPGILSNSRPDIEKPYPLGTAHMQKGTSKNSN